MNDLSSDITNGHGLKWCIKKDSKLRKESLNLTIKLFLKEFYLTVILVLDNKLFIYEAAHLIMMMRWRSATF